MSWLDDLRKSLPAKYEPYFDTLVDLLRTMSQRQQQAYAKVLLAGGVDRIIETRKILMRAKTKQARLAAQQQTTAEFRASVDGIVADKKRFDEFCLALLQLVLAGAISKL